MKQMTLNEVRQKYLAFFEKRGHKIIPSASLVPENDPTTLFTGSGMQPLVPYLLGQKHPLGARLVNSQKCFRSEDIEEVGDNRHTTFFEMLGNWSLGSPDAPDKVGAGYWKEEQLNWIFEFLTVELQISKEKLAVTWFEGDEKLGLPKDTESQEIWKKIGISSDRIFFYNAKKNWWSRSGAPEKMPTGEPGGPDSEIFYEFTQIEHDKKFGEKCHPNCDCGRFMEIGNSVFMEYSKTENGFEKLKQRNVDFGGGLERITSAVNNEPDVFRVDVLESVIKEIEKISGKSYEDEHFTRSFRIIADHIRASVFLTADGIDSSNTDRGYFVRRLLRRAMYHLHKFKSDIRTASLIYGLIKNYDGYYENLYVKQNDIDKLITDEETKFHGAIMFGLRAFEKMAKNNISGNDAFLLFSSYGFPIEMTVELASEKGLIIDLEGFELEMRKHQEISRAGAEKKFKGGLADHSEISVKYHTATHLLHQALRDVLGDEVRQKGSNITPERLRFDFAFPRKMTDEEKTRVENIVNEKIKDGLPVQKIVLPLAQAEKTGALHFFGEKYGDEVSVYFIGDSLAKAYSKEFCGGPHVANTGVIGNFKITKDEAVSQGVRRIKAMLE